MVASGTYAIYKRETAHLVFWIVKAYNSVVASLDRSGNHGYSTNTTGKTTTAGFLSMTKLIAENLDSVSVPHVILHLFDSVIKNRTAMYNSYVELTVKRSDPEMEQDNKTHKHFIDTLSECLNLLKRTQPDRSSNPLASERVTASKLEFLVSLANKFEVLELEGTSLEYVEGGDEDVDLHNTNSLRRAANNTSHKDTNGKAAKGKKSKKARPKKPMPSHDAVSDNIPVESYRFIEGDHGMVTEYSLAVYALAEEWITLRVLNQKTWREVAYDGVNGAIATAVSFMATKMIAKSENAIFVDFVGHDTYDVVMNTVTKGKAKAVNDFEPQRIYAIQTDGRQRGHPTDLPLDLKELYMINTYFDLLAFIEDFRKNRNGKPTRVMQNQIRLWKSTEDLSQKSKEERLKWRRIYTIGWLYDLVNLFSVIVVRKRSCGPVDAYALKGKDFSKCRIWEDRCRLFSLNGFAPFILSIVMEPPRNDVRKSILPHHVFQLQCIVDSLTVSLGWSNSAWDHVIVNAAPDFHPRRDVDLFLNIEAKGCRRSMFQAACNVSDMFHDSDVLREDPYAKFISRKWCGMAGNELRARGQEAMLMLPDPDGTLPFSQAKWNGLWDHSPYLCGAFLVEALEFAHRSAIPLWESLREPFLAAHLYNFLWHKEHLKNSSRLHSVLLELFREIFFVNGMQPHTDFAEALKQYMKSRSSSPTLDSKTQTALSVCHNSGWDPERISDDTLFQPGSELPLLWLHRILGRVVRDPDLHCCMHTDADPLLQLKRKFPCLISDENWDLLAAPLARADLQHGQEDRIQFVQRTGFTETPEAFQKVLSRGPRHTSQELLAIIKKDLIYDISGGQCRSSFNYFDLLTCIPWLFMDIENELARRNHSAYTRIYSTACKSLRRYELVLYAMEGQDEELLQVMAMVFEKSGLCNLVYWDTTCDPLEGKERKPGSLWEDPDACIAM